MKKYICVTGAVNSGKTTTLNALCSRWDSLGMRIGGMIGVLPFPHEEKKDWQLSDLGTGEVRLLMSTSYHHMWRQYGRFWIDHTVFDWANERIIAMCDESDIIVFDEIGPLELLSEGFFPSFTQVLSTFDGTIITVIRESLIDEVCSTFSLTKSDLFCINTAFSLDEQYDTLMHHE